MNKTAKFTVSVPREDFEALEELRRTSGQSRSAFILEAIRLRFAKGGESSGRQFRSSAVQEEHSGYRNEETESDMGKPSFMIDSVELRRRAIAAAGRFQSKSEDLSKKHDEVLAEVFAAVDTNEDMGKRRKP